MTTHPSGTPWDYDVLLIGAGPAGLCCAVALAKGDEDLRIGILEKAPEATLADPKEDGRDIALTRDSRAILDHLGVWAHIPPAVVSPLQEARILNGEGLHFLRFAEDTPRGSGEPLGVFVPHHVIRKAAFRTVKAHKGVSLLCEQEVKHVENGTVTLGNGTTLRAPLVIASDSRFSTTRRQVGIATHMFDFSRTCLVARVSHQHEHGGVAYECFNGPLTLATLPQQGRESSVVLTLPHEQVQRVLEMDADAFGAFIADAFFHRLGTMRRLTTPHTYPLIATYATRFIAQRFAVIGDAAVGMHPITAHGFNFGLKSGWTLSREVTQARAVGGDIGSSLLLRRYERAHRKATLPLFLATNAIVQLYASAHPFARRVQNALIRIGAGVKPVRRLIVKRLIRTPSSPFSSSSDRTRRWTTG